MRLIPDGVRRPASAVAATALVSAALVLLPAAPAAADEADCIQSASDDPDTDLVKGDSAPLLSMQVPQAREQMLDQERPVDPGEGIGVAVIDSGIVEGDDKGLEVRGALESGEPIQPQVAYYQGTVVAGLIAGKTRTNGNDDLDDDQPIGVAPGADVYDVRVYDATAEESTSTEDAITPGPDQVLAGLEAVQRNLGGVEGGAPIRIVNVSMQVQADERIDAAVAELAKDGVIVVANSGDRPDDPETAGFLSDYAVEGTPPPGEDAADVVGPANARDAVSVTASGPLGLDLSELLLRNSRTDLAAPTEGAVSFGLSGETCNLAELGARWATALVSGTLALVWSDLGADTPAQRVIDVLERTATGNGTRSSATGFGVVQPFEAITRPLGGGQGSIPELQSEVAGEEPATAPEPEEDVLASTRRNAVWWGLVGGSALVVALILRPLLARRRD